MAAIDAFNDRDEVMEGHPPSGKGLGSYGAHRVVNSHGIAEEEQINSVHSMHSGGWHDSLNHYLFCFHDLMFECLAHGVTACRSSTSPRDLLHKPPINSSNERAGLDDFATCADGRLGGQT